MKTKILKKLDRLFKSDSEYLLKGGFWLFLGTFWTTVFNLGLAITFAHFLTAETYGNYKFILSMIGSFAAFSLTGTGPAIARSAAENLDGSLAKFYRVQIRWTLIASLISLGTSGYYSIMGNKILAFGFLFSAFLLPLYNSVTVYTGFLLGKKAFAKFSIFESLRYGFIFIVMLFAMLNFKDPLVLAMIYMTSFTAIGLLFLQRTAKEEVRNNNDDDASLRFSKHLSLMNFLGRIAAKIDEVLIFHFLGPAKLAIYSFALAMPRQIKSFNGVVKNLIFPKMVTMEFKDLKKQLPYKIVLFLFAVIILVVLYVVFSPLVFRLLFPQYLESVVFSRVFSINLIIAAPMLFLNQSFMAHMKKERLYIIKISSSVLKIGLFIVLVPMYGIWGAILTLLIAPAFNLLLQGYLFFRS